MISPVIGENVYVQTLTDSRHQYVSGDVFELFNTYTSHSALSALSPNLPFPDTSIDKVTAFCRFADPSPGLAISLLGGDRESASDIEREFELSLMVIFRRSTERSVYRASMLWRRRTEEPTYRTSPTRRTESDVRLLEFK